MSMHREMILDIERWETEGGRVRSDEAVAGSLHAVRCGRAGVGAEPRVVTERVPARTDAAPGLAANPR